MKLKNGKIKLNEKRSSIRALYEGGELALNAFKSVIFPIKATKGKRRPSNSAPVGRVAKFSDHSNSKILSTKQMLQRLSIALSQVKAGSTSENLLNEITQIICSLYREKGVTKK